MKRRLLLSVACFMAFALVSAGAAGAQQKPDGGPITVGILLLNKPFITEFAGPLDVYHHVSAEKIKVFIVSDTDKEQVTYEGMPFRANYTIDNVPKDATTFTANTDALQEQYPTCRVQKDRRVVVDGNLITSPGGLASYEASLYVVEQLFGKDEALTIASALIFGPSNIEAATATK